MNSYLPHTVCTASGLVSRLGCASIAKYIEILSRIAVAEVVTRYEGA